MKVTLEHYALLADVFQYPDESLADRAKATQSFLDRSYPEAGEAMRPFTSFVEKASMIELEELYTRSFDVQAVTTLDLGYVLFGDDYKRGALLVNLNREHREADNPCYNELADHLPNVLRLLPRLHDAELRDELVEKIVGSALRKIIGEFDPEKIDKKKKVYLKHHKTWIDRSEAYGTIYRKPLIALYAVLREDFSLQEAPAPEPTSDFLKNIGTEITLEAE